MIKGMVSVIVPNLNYAHFLLETLDSVIAQTYKNWELIVVDDNSTDNSREVVQSYIDKYSDLKIRLIHNRVGPSGTPTPINIGIKNMQGEYFAWLSSDDVFLPQKLEKEIEVFSQNHNLGMVHTAFDIIDDDGNITTMSFSDFNSMSKVDFFLSQLMANRINANTGLIHKSVFDTVGLFKEKSDICPIFWCVTEVLKWYEIGIHFPIHFINEKLHHARVHKAKDPVYQSKIAPKLRGYIIESFLEKWDLQDFYKKLDASEMDQIIYIETRIAKIYSNHQKVVSLFSRWEKLKDFNQKIYTEVVKNIELLDHLDLIFKHAKLIILKNKNFHEIISYSIDYPLLKYLEKPHLYTIASVYKKAGKYEIAEKIFNEVLVKPFKADEYLAGAHFHLGEIHMKKNDLNKSIDHFNDCLKINPEHYSAKKHLIDLSKRKK